jgi:hypothetical protein
VPPCWPASARRTLIVLPYYHPARVVEEIGMLDHSFESLVHAKTSWASVMPSPLGQV